MVSSDILKDKKHIHFIGIGGSGMYPLAQILNKQGYYLTGSDNNETETLDAVRKMGIRITSYNVCYTKLLRMQLTGHSGSQAPQLIHSSVIL